MPENQNYSAPDQRQARERNSGFAEVPGFARTDENGKLFAAAAERNGDAIIGLVQDLGLENGKALEIASGTGQHIVRLAGQFPHVTWHPTDIDPRRRASVDAYAAENGLRNIRKAVDLDACRSGWAQRHSGFDMVLLCNLLHLISRRDADTLIEEVAQALAPGGRFVLYGPFMRNGTLTSDGDRAFHAKLAAADPAVGYKNDEDIAQMLHANWLELDRVVEMPANNLAFVARRST